MELAPFKQVTRNGLKSFILNGLSFLLLVVTQVALTRVLTVEEYGVYSLALSIISVLVLLSVCGADTFLLTRVAQARAAQASGEVRALYRWSCRYGAYAGGVSSFVFVIVAGGALFTQVEPLKYVGVVAGGGLFLAAWTMLSVRQAYFRGAEEILPARIPDVVIRPLLFIVLIFFAYLSGAVSAGIALLLHALGAWCAYGLALIRYPVKEKLGGEPYLNLTAAWRKVALGYLTISLLTVWLVEVDKLLLGALTESVHLGKYALASRMAQFVNFGADTLLLVAVPALQRVLAGGGKQEVRILYRKTQIVMGGTAWACTLLFSLFGESLLAFFGEEYRSILPELVTLSIGAAIALSFGPAGYMLLISGRTAALVRVLFIQAILAVPLLALLYSYSGTLGVALGMNILLVSKAIIFYLLMRNDTQPTR
jgi:O-antigen/teichoic acid export membrane protein